MVAAGSQAPGLSAPTLLDGSSPAFSSIAGRQAKKFCLKLDVVLKSPDIYMKRRFAITTLLVFDYPDFQEFFFNTL